MIFSYEIPLLLLVLVTAAGVMWVKDLISSVLLLGTYSFFLSLAWAWLGAVDVAFVEAVVGAGLATVLFLLTLFGTDPKDTRLRRPPPSLATLIVFPLLGILYSMPLVICLSLATQILQLVFIYHPLILSEAIRIPTLQML